MTKNDKKSQIPPKSRTFKSEIRQKEFLARLD